MFVEYSLNIFRKYSLDTRPTAAHIRISVAMFMEYSRNIFREYSLDITAANIRISVAMFMEYSRNIFREYSLVITPANSRECSVLAGLRPLKPLSQYRGIYTIIDIN